MTSKEFDERLTTVISDLRHSIVTGSAAHMIRGGSIVQAVQMSNQYEKKAEAAIRELIGEGLPQKTYIHDGAAGDEATWEAAQNELLDQMLVRFGITKEEK
jgi:hypothetical protein